jgi:hypothetical protein
MHYSRFHTTKTHCCIAFLLSFIACQAAAQIGADAQVDSEPSKAVPVLTGAFGVVPSFQPSNQTLDYKFEPIILLPIMDNLLVETEYSMELPVSRQDGSFGPAVLTHGFEYLQLDYLVHPNPDRSSGLLCNPFRDLQGAPRPAVDSQSPGSSPNIRDERQLQQWYFASRRSPSVGGSKAELCDVLFGPSL